MDLAQMPHDAWLHQQQFRRAATAHQEALAKQLQQLPPEEREVLQTPPLARDPVWYCTM